MEVKEVKSIFGAKLGSLTTQVVVGNIYLRAIRSSFEEKKCVLKEERIG